MRAPGPRSLAAALLMPLLGGNALAASGRPPMSADPDLRLTATEAPSTVVGLGRQAVLTQQRLAAGPAVKVSVHEAGPGWYRVTGAALAAMGTASPLLTADPRRLQLFLHGREQTMVVRAGEDGRLDPDDSLEFYAAGMDTPWSNEHIYWLVAGEEPGRRVGMALGMGTGIAPAADHTGFLHTVVRRDSSAYFAGLLNGDLPNFFGPFIGKEPAQQTITVPNPAELADAQLEVAFQGVGFAPHQISVTWGTRLLGAVSFANRAQASKVFTVPAAALVPGDNKLMVRAEGGPSDTSFVDHVRLTYLHKYVADDGMLLFDAAADATRQIGGFDSKDIRVFDVTQAASVQELPTVVSPEAQGFSVTVRIPGPADGTAPERSRTLLAVTPKAIRTPSLAPNQPSSWHSPGLAADLILITHPEFLDALAPLLARRQREGWTPALVTVDDLYDEFSFGEKDPAAIRSFLALQMRGRHAPRSVLLVGDATFDPKNLLGKGSWDFVPTKLIDTDDLETSSDDWFVDFDDDGIPEMPIGRLPVRTVAQARAVVAKIVGFMPGLPAQLAGNTLLFVGDYDPLPELDFEGAIRDIRTAIPAAIPAALTVVEILRRGLGADAAHRALGEALMAGPFLVDYVGHGSVETWGGSWVQSSFLTGMPAAKPMSLLLATTCLNGFFQDVYTTSVTEAMLLAPTGGAVAAIGSSSLGELADQVVLSRELLRMTLQEGLPLGLALQRAKAAIKDREIQQTYMLFGDPSARLVTVSPGAALVIEDAAPPAVTVGCSVAGAPHKAPAAAFCLGSAVGLCAMLRRRRRR